MRGASRVRQARALVAAALIGGCGGPVYELRPVASAVTSDGLVTARARRVEWIGALGDHCVATVDLEVTNADPARPVSVGPPRLVARSALGGPSFDFELDSQDLDADPLTAGSAAAKAPRALASGATRVSRAKFVSNGPDAPQGPFHLAVLLPVEGQRPLEIAIADPRPGGPRWVTSRPSPGAYFRGGWAVLGGRSDAFQVMEPVGISGRRAFGHWIVGFDERYTFLYRTAALVAEPETAMGLSLLVNLTWEPWRFPIAPYVEGGGYGGFETDRARDGSSRWTASPRTSGGLAIMFGPRLGSGGALPFEAPASPQRPAGFRLGYTHWFYTGERGGTGGIELSLEVGFGRQ